MFVVSDGGVDLTAALVPWDTEVFGYAVAELRPFLHTPSGSVRLSFAQLAEWRDRAGVELMYCRLPCASLQESMLLEEHGFRFVEVVLHPTIPNLQDRALKSPTFSVTVAEPDDLEAIANIAELAFGYERYHADPRMDSARASARYGRWVRSTIEQPTYSLLKISSVEDELVAFFAVEETGPSQLAWRLTAVAPEFQGRGMGAGIWSSVLQYHQTRGFESVVTTIASRNVPVLNLYSRLQFRFEPPEMTFHWLRGG